LSWKTISPYWDTVFDSIIEGNMDNITAVNRHFGF